MIKLHDWSIGNGHFVGNYWDENASLCLHGNVEDHPTRKNGDFVFTSEIESFEGRMVRTKSGNTYFLRGENREWLCYLNSVGIEYDPDDPIGCVIRKAVGDEGEM